VESQSAYEKLDIVDTVLNSTKIAVPKQIILLVGVERTRNDVVKNCIARTAL
jgi:hypothetical protein